MMMRNLTVPNNASLVRCYVRITRSLIPSMDVNGSVCVAFYYHMWGYHMGRLEVYTKQDNQYTRQWSVYGDQGNVWLERRLTIKNLQPTDQVNQLVHMVFSLFVPRAAPYGL